MNTDLLGQALRDATEELRPRTGFTGSVLRGGRRRRARRQVAVVAGIAVATAIAGVATTAVWPAPSSEQSAAADPRMRQATRGDLAGDRRLLADVTSAWLDGIEVSYRAGSGLFDDLRGAPHVYWAGTTPAGAAAVVLQEAHLPSEAQRGERRVKSPQTLVGLVAIDPKDGRLKLVGDQFQGYDAAPPGAFRFGPGDRTVLVVDVGEPLYYSDAARTAPDGTSVREWRRLPVVEGVAVVRAAGADPADARVAAGDRAPAPHADPGDLLRLVPASEYLSWGERRSQTGGALRGGGFEYYVHEPHTLPWKDAGVLRIGTNPRVPRFPSEFEQVLEDAKAIDVGLRYSGSGGWVVAARLPDGRTAWVGELQQERDASRLFALVMRPDGSVGTVVPGDTVRPEDAIPVRMRMPDGQGWVVAAYGAELSYRTAPDGRWRAAGRDAALLPDGAVAVRVDRDGRAPAEADLPR